MDRVALPPGVSIQFLDREKGGILTGYKIVYGDLTAQGNFKFELNKWYHQDGDIKLCKNGFHFCSEAPFCMDTTPYNACVNPVYTRVECSGKIVHGSHGKSVCSDIRIVQIISQEEWNKICTGRFTTPGGDVKYYLNGLLHRIDGPAVITRDGTRMWYLFGKLDCPNGPAILYPNGTGRWYIDGKQINSML